MKNTIAVFVVLSLATVGFGCAAATGSRLQVNQDVLNDFLAYKVMPGYRYYIFGMENNPDAILGLKEGYALKSEVWKERQLNSEQLGKLVWMMNDTYGAVQLGLAGADVLNDREEKIGVWYSATVRPIVEMAGEKTITVTPPNQMELDEKKVKGGRGD